MIRKAVIPAAGYGIRFLPATKAQPKEMLPIIDTPTIQYVVQEAIDSGIEDILIISGKGKRAIEDHFDRNLELELQLEGKQDEVLYNEMLRISDMANIHYIRQKELKGLGDAIYCARLHTGDEPFVVLLGDTIIDSVIDENYSDDEALAMDLAAAIRMEVEALAAAGCNVVQFDEPVFARYPKRVSEYGLRALEACFEGIAGITTVAHICCGYPVEGYEKAESDSYTQLAPRLADSKIDQISIEGAHRSLDLGVLRKFGDKVVILGVVDIGDSRIETADEIEARIGQALDHIRPDRLSLGPDCGMVFLDPEVAKAKLTNLVEGARRVRESLH